MSNTETTDTRTLIAAWLQKNPAHSDRSIADAVGCAHKTVGRVRRQLEDAGAIEPQPIRLASDGRQIPAHAAGRRPEILLPSDNDLGIPVLRGDMQAAQAPLPLRAWGRRGRRKANPGGLWHFYVDDYRFSAIWKDPGQVLATSPAAVVEPNFSILADMPPVVALWHIYRKRFLGRYYQDNGIRVLVDLNVATEHRQRNLIGVPAGWRAYATRAYSDRLGDTVDEYRAACDHCGRAGDVTFLVIGGGQGAQALAREYGWLWVRGAGDHG
jgi:hypothetical protein